MDVHITFPSQENIISGISDFTYKWGVNAGLSASSATRLALATTEIITDIILFAFLGKEEEFEMSFRASSKNVEVIIHEFGEPFNPERHIYSIEKVKKSGNFKGAGLHLIRHLVDDFFFFNKGKKGKEFRMVQRITDPHIAELFTQRELLPIGPKPFDKKKYEYICNSIISEDAEDISKLIYRTYKHTYYKDMLYYPKKIALAIERNEKFGVITRNRLQEAIGYFAVIKQQDSNIGEVGEAVVLKDHRRRGIMTKMLYQLIELAREKELAGLFGEANAAHVFSQKANAKFNFKSTALLLAMMPAMKMIGFPANHTDQAVSAILEFLPLKRMSPREVFLPDEYKDILRLIYDQFDVMVVDLEDQDEYHLSETTVVDIQIDYDEKFGLIVLKTYGTEFNTIIRRTLRDLTKAQIQTIHIDLPLSEQYTRKATKILRKIGFYLSGLVPMFHYNMDYLRMQITFVPLDFQKIGAYTEIARLLKEIVIKEKDENS
jgi:anti-sigma regulatory factor (Ser/Thr protein kinase)/N-acetylglutamate synthase-like GNAT family acetyltransferase